jgi:hypothetical protein
MDFGDMTSVQEAHYYAALQHFWHARFRDRSEEFPISDELAQETMSAPSSCRPVDKVIFNDHGQEFQVLHYVLLNESRDEPSRTDGHDGSPASRLPKSIVELAI